jgi:hypothetical protein
MTLMVAVDQPAGFLVRGSSSWPTPRPYRVLGQERKSAAARVWERLELHVAAGWLPSNPDDPAIVQAFREGGFPEDADPGRSKEP